ncbi:MAG: 2-amino-4-hydroxy-6-hydroxymethyldihydropteridine diphosphokinase [Candidatus Paceibacterota bacterium]|jgi:2-amino-4-hydroxy-6-hydroxymethyldihydropteridine diphosphokinase
MHTVFLALGSNMGEREAFINKAIDLLRKEINVEKCAPIYESKAAGFSDQNDFANTVLLGQTSLSSDELLSFIKKTEKDLGRIERFTWGPREIDIDIIFYDDLIYKNETLEIPHPRIAERDFVLKPLSDIAPDYIHPVLLKTIEELLNELPVDQKFITGILTK